MYNTALFTWEHVKDTDTFCKVALDDSFAQEVEKKTLVHLQSDFLDSYSSWAIKDASS